jgi:hypothetical protein
VLALAENLPAVMEAMSLRAKPNIITFFIHL